MMSCCFLRSGCARPLRSGIQYKRKVLSLFCIICCRISRNWGCLRTKKWWMMMRRKWMKTHRCCGWWPNTLSWKIFCMFTTSSVKTSSCFRTSQSCPGVLIQPFYFFLILSLHLTSPGGYDVIKTRQGKGMCVSLTTSYEGVYLDTYNLDIDLKPRVRIVRHNIPPFIPMNELAERSNMQTDLRAFLGTLRLHLNAFAGRKQQLKLIKVPDFASFLYLKSSFSVFISIYQGYVLLFYFLVNSGKRFFHT